MIATQPDKEVCSTPHATRTIISGLREADKALIAKYPVLGRDDFIAMLLFLASWTTIGATIAAWSIGSLGTLLTVCILAMALSVLHEMEHDLIHDLYLSHPLVRNTVFTSIWIAKATLSPWNRRRLHLWHHSISGQKEDIEERLIGLGMRWGLLRLFVTLFPFGPAVLTGTVTRAVIKRGREGGRMPDLREPKGWWVIHIITGLFFILPIVGAVGLALDATWAWPLLVLWVFPNVIRHAAIVMMSSNSHYAAIRRGQLVEQNQILDHPLFWPLQMWCWNFGATHVLHHFFVRQPFWRRTLIFGKVRQLLIDNGVVANDLGTFARANRRIA